MQEVGARLMLDFIKLLNNPAFVPLSINVACIGGRVIVGHTVDDIGNALTTLLEKVIILLLHNIF